MVCGTVHNLDCSRGVELAECKVAAKASSARHAIQAIAGELDFRLFFFLRLQV
jgi:hypothetical protein